MNQKHKKMSEIKTNEGTISFNFNKCEEDVPVFGVKLELIGSITFVANEIGADMMFFKLHINGSKNDILCRYDYIDYIPILPGDKAIVKGEYGIEIFNAKESYCFIVSFIHARYDFDLNTFLSLNYPKINNSTLTKISNKILEYSEEYYEYGTPGVIKCLVSLSNDLKDLKSFDEIELFTEYIYGKDNLNSNVEFIKKFLCKFLNNGLKRPLQLLGISNSNIENISRPLDEVYNIVLENPFRIPEIDIDRAEKICKYHLRIKDIPEEWIKCGEISRMVYNALKNKKWTSVPISKLEKSFPLSFERYKHIVLKHYYCVEDLEHFYYVPIKSQENVCSNYIAKLLLNNNTDFLDPIYNTNFDPDKSQQEAIIGALKNKLSIITGAGGTGKTEILSCICQTLIRQDKSPICLTLTGCASNKIKDVFRRANIIDNCEAMTIAMFITISQSIDMKKINHIFFDECSMIDLTLFYKCVKIFMIYDLSVTFIGDLNQLPPIGYGNVMQQLLKTSIPIFRLNVNHRSEVGILEMCEQVIDNERLQKQQLIEWIRNFNDYYFYEGGINLLKQFLQYQYDEHQFINDSIFLNFRDQFTVINPYKRYVKDINIMFQEIFMIKYPFVVIDSKKYHIYDRVMKLVNNHSTTIMNGEIGIIVEINSDFVIIEFRKNKSTRCPFFGNSKLKKMREIKKEIGSSFSLYTTDENGKTLEKDNIVIKNELADLQNKFKCNKFKQEEIDEFFVLAKEYPFAIFSIKDENSEFLNLREIDLGYAMTVYKSQGHGFHTTICSFFGKYNAFVDIKQLYTSLSRAEKNLIVFTESTQLINSISLTCSKFTYENLALKINNKLPENMRVEVNQNEYIEEINDFGDFNDFNDFDDVEFASDDCF